MHEYGHHPGQHGQEDANREKTKDGNEEVQARLI